jgi:hypothetical protein
MHHSSNHLQDLGSLLRTVTSAKEHVEQARRALQEARSALALAQKLSRPAGCVVATPHRALSCSSFSER